MSELASCSFAPAARADQIAALDDLPVMATSARAGFSGIGGGWLSCLGYDDAPRGAAFYDSVLRWRPAAGCRTGCRPTTRGTRGCPASGGSR